MWQRDFYEHIIRNEDEYRRIAEYIINNPMKWDLDNMNPLKNKENSISATEVVRLIC
jgi:putative transposase